MCARLDSCRNELKICADELKICDSNSNPVRASMASVVMHICKMNMNLPPWLYYVPPWREVVGRTAGIYPGFVGVQEQGVVEVTVAGRTCAPGYARSVPWFPAAGQEDLVSSVQPTAAEPASRKYGIKIYLCHCVVISVHVLSNFICKPLGPIS